jgi:hypothetical protein
VEDCRSIDEVAKHVDLAAFVPEQRERLDTLPPM